MTIQLTQAVLDGLRDALSDDAIDHSALRPTTCCLRSADFLSQGVTRPISRVWSTYPDSILSEDLSILASLDSWIGGGSRYAFLLPD
jgi:hypothetical protein